MCTKGRDVINASLWPCAYWEFLVHGEQLQAPIPTTKRVQRVPVPLGKGERVHPFSVARVRPRTSKGIQHLLLLNLVLLDAASPSKKRFWMEPRTIQLTKAKARGRKSKSKNQGQAAKPPALFKNYLLKISNRQPPLFIVSFKRPRKILSNGVSHLIVLQKLPKLQPETLLKKWRKSSLFHRMMKFSMVPAATGRLLEKMCDNNHAFLHHQDPQSTCSS